MEETKILLVEDNPGDARLVREALSGRASALTHVTSLGQAIAHVSEAPVDLVLLDLGLGDASGLVVIERIRAATLAPIVILTADNSYELAMKALELGADDFIVKNEIHDYTLERVIGYTFERRELRAALERSQSRFQALVENSFDAVFVVDDSGTITYASPGVKNILGIDPESQTGQNAFVYVHPDDLESAMRQLASITTVAGATAEIEVRARHADGTYRWVNLRGRNLMDNEAVAGIVVNYHDVTDRKRYETDLRQTVDLFHGAFHASRTGIALIGARDNAYVDVNDALCEMLGYTRAELLGLDWRAITHADDRDKSLVEVADFLAGRNEVGTLHKRYVCKDGAVISVEINDAVVRTADGEPQYFVTHVTDVTQREAAAKALRESQELLQAVINNSPALIYIKDLEGRYLLANSRVVESRGEVVGKTPHDILPQETADVVGENDRRVFETLEPIEVEETIIDADGETRTYLSVKFPLIAENGNCYALCGISTDISDRANAQQEKQRLEEQLRQSQKLEAVGQLAGGVAHDFNNLLAVILNYAQFVSEDIGPHHPNNGDLNEIIRAAQLGGSLTRQLLTFSRKEICQPIILELNEIISGMERLLSRTIRESIDLKVSLAEESWPIVADAGHVEQILMNLAVNAKDAMPTGGILSIETRNVFIDEAYAAARPGLAVGEYACLAVSDTGCGMDEETRGRIFEPFFTTKPKDRGTGLGLATVYGIVKQSGGHITCYSEPGIGTTFKAYFPRSTADRIRPSIGGKQEEEVDGHGVVLLVEDDDAVMKIGVRILEKAGYTVHTAASGDEALSKFRHRVHEIDLLVSDVVMPGDVSGKTLSEQLGCPTLFVSGYTDNVIVEVGGLVDETFLQKPFSAEGLLEAVRNAIKVGNATLGVHDIHEASRTGGDRSPTLTSPRAWDLP